MAEFFGEGVFEFVELFFPIGDVGLGVGDHLVVLVFGVGEGVDLVDEGLGLGFGSGDALASVVGDVVVGGLDLVFELADVVTGVVELGEA